MIPSLDTHAHIRPDIAAHELTSLSACVVAVTRTLAEYESTRERSDSGVVWGAGCHPGLVREVRGFSAARLRDAVSTTPIIGEIGLDGSARTPMDAQRQAFRAALDVAADTPRILSIHSYRATGLVLQELREVRPRAAVLHWWLGSAAETEEAVELGAYFSVNASQARKWPNLRVIPLDRLLLESDHPFGDRIEPEPRRPGNIRNAEQESAQVFGVSAEYLRSQTWRTLRAIAERLELEALFPHDFQVQFLAS